jgi:hypothetical protein
MKTSEVKHWIEMLEELQQDTVIQLEGNDSLIGIAVSIAEQYIKQQAKLERCLDVLEEVHETLAFSEHLGVISKLLHDLGRYKESE